LYERVFLSGRMVLREDESVDAVEATDGGEEPGPAGGTGRPAGGGAGGFAAALLSGKNELTARTIPRTISSSVSGAAATCPSGVSNLKKKMFIEWSKWASFWAC
jgi:hypothetical protein